MKVNTQPAQSQEFNRGGNTQGQDDSAHGFLSNDEGGPLDLLGLKRTHKRAHSR